MDEASKAKSLIQPKRPGQQPKPPWMRERRKNQVSKSSLTEATIGDSFHLWAGCLQQRVILNSRGASRHTGHAAETGIDVLNEARRIGLTPIAPHLHQVDASSRRVGFQTPEEIGRARRQTEAAVDAVVEQIACGCVRVR
jgi:hypothetical protein